MRQVITASILLFIGLIVGYFIPHIGEVPESDKIDSSVQVSKQEYDELKKTAEKAKQLEEKINTLSEINLEEYVTLKDQKERYLKADELFGKVMLLFLADLSLHMNEKVKEWANESPEERREHFNNVFSQSYSSSETVLPTVAEPVDFELSGDQDEKQFQREQVLNAKQPFRGNLSFKDKLGRSMKNLMDPRVVNELWGKDVWKGPTQPIQHDQIVYYEVRRNGEFRRGKKTVAKIDFKLEINELKNSKKQFSTRLKISIKNSKRFYFHFDDKVEALHPTTHNKFGDGPCRGVILKGEKGILVYLSYLRDRSGKPDDKLIVGRLIDTRLKNPILGNFLLEKSN